MGKRGMRDADTRAAKLIANLAYVPRLLVPRPSYLVYSSLVYSSLVYSYLVPHTSYLL